MVRRVFLFSPRVSAMRKHSHKLGQELRRLKTRKGLSYDGIMKACDAHANETSPYKPPPYADASSLSKIFNGRVPPRPALLYLLVWGLEADQEEINTVLAIANYAA